LYGTAKIACACASAKVVDMLHWTRRMLFISLVMLFVETMLACLGAQTVSPQQAGG